MKKKLMVRTNIYLSKIQISKLKFYSEESGIPVAEHVRRALDSYLETMDNK